MIRPKLYSLLIWAILARLLASCGADDGYITPPDIQIISPYQGQTFGFGDTIAIRADITHHRPLSYAKVTLLNSAGIPAMAAGDFTVNGNSLNLSATLALDNPQLAGGAYSIQVRAGDGEAEASEYVKIQYQELERELVSVMAVAEKSAQDYVVYEIPLSGQMKERFQFQGDYSGAAISALNGQLYTAGSISGSLSAWNLSRNVVDWSVPAVVNPSLPYFHHLYCDGEVAFASDRDGYIKGYARNGEVMFRSARFDNGKFTKFIRYKNWLIAVFKPFNGVFNDLVVLNYPAGTVFRQIQFMGEAVHMAGMGKEGILLFVNSGSEASALSFSVDDNVLVQLKTFSFSHIDKVSGPEDGNCFIATGNEVWWYRPAIGSAVKYLEPGNISSLQYDPLSGLIFVSSGNEVSAYRLPEAGAVSKVATGAEIVDLLLYYNR